MVSRTHFYYNTLFASLRRAFDEAIAAAQEAERGNWPTDRTQTGVQVSSHEDLATISPIWPKLWRRMDEYLAAHPSLAGFHDFLEQKNERIDILSIMEERGLQDIVEVKGAKVRLTVDPSDVRVVGEAGQRNR